MVNPESGTTQEREVELTEEHFARGRKFVDGLVALKVGLEELGMMPAENQRYYLRDGFSMVVVPSEPVPRKLVAWKYHKGPVKTVEDIVSDPFQLTSVKINGLYDVTKRDFLEIEGSGPELPSEDKYEAHFWSPVYVFDPRQHQIAIINPNAD